MPTIDEFISKHGLRSIIDRAESNPNMNDSDWAASHWQIVIRRNTAECGMTTYFSQGSALTEPPTLADVLDCLASDAASVENASSFEEWCAEYGCDTDSRKAERTYNACKKQADDLKRLLGSAYEALLWEVKRQ